MYRTSRSVTCFVYLCSMLKYSSRVQTALVLATEIVDRQSDKYNSLPAQAKSKAAMQIIDLLCKADAFACSNGQAPGSHKDPLAILLVALIKAQADCGLIKASPPAPETVKEKTDALRNEFYTELDALLSPLASNQLICATLDTRMTWIPAICQKLETLSARLPAGTPVELADLLTSLEAGRVLDSDSCGIRINGSLRHVMCQMVAFFIHCRLFIISEVMARRKVVDLRQRLVFEREVHRRGVSDLPPFEYFSKWLNVFETRRQDTGSASSVHALFSETFLWSTTPLGYKAWVGRCSPWQSSGGQMYLGPKIGTEKYTALLVRSRTRGKEIDPSTQPDLLNYWCLAQWCDFVRAQQMDVRSRTRSQSQLSAQERVEQAALDGVSPFIEHYLVTWNDWGTESAYRKVMTRRRLGELSRPIICVLGHDSFGVRTDTSVYLYSDIRLAIAHWASLCGPTLEGGMPTPSFSN